MTTDIQPGGVAHFGLAMLKHWKTTHRHAAQLRAMHLKKCKRQGKNCSSEKLDAELSGLFWGMCALETEAQQMEPAIVRAGGILLLVEP